MVMKSGDVIKLNVGATCVHCDEADVPAEVTIVGEIDSFGFEPLDLCKACYDRVIEEIS
jgi:hypothetical protein